MTTRSRLRFRTASSLRLRRRHFAHPAVIHSRLFWPMKSRFGRSDESSANPDIEIMRAVRPGMASIPGSILLLASSPYAKKGELYNAFRRHFGKDDGRVLVWKAPTSTMN